MIMGIDAQRGPFFGSIDALLPTDIARACEAAGTTKASRDAWDLLVLGLLAGAFIALGAVFMITVLAGTAGEMPWGVARLVAGVVFSLGLILVIVGGGELFTGDSLMIVAFACHRVSLSALLRAWSLVYIGNVCGAFGTAALVFLAGHYTLDGGAVGKLALEIAASKATLPAGHLLFLAILCNVLVCLAVWMSFGARSTADKVAVIVPPIAAFVACGFEHSIANLFFLPYGLAIKIFAGPEFWDSIQQASTDYDRLTFLRSMKNIIVATLGNMIGGSLMVGAVFWMLYLRRKSQPPGS